MPDQLLSSSRALVPLPQRLQFMARLMREPAAPAGIPKYHGGPAARQAAGPAAAAPAAAAPVGKPSSKEEVSVVSLQVCAMVWWPHSSCRL